MERLKTFATDRPIAFVVLLAVLQPLLAFPFVALFKLGGWDIVALRLIIPAVQSAFIFWLIRGLGWRSRSGLGPGVRNVHLLWYPVLVGFAPVLLYGTVEISAGWIAFYAAALVFTGLSEEGFARGIAIPALLRHGRWAAVLIAAGIFSAGHFTNLFFEDFTLLEWADKFTSTFGFAILYGALFLRTGNLWPLVVLHAIHDYSYLTSGALGPFVATPIDIPLHMGLAALNAAYGIMILLVVPGDQSPEPRSAPLTPPGT